jgi:hypothetical protein
MTKASRLTVLLTAVNLLVLVILLSHDEPALAQGDAPILRGSGLELVDADGQVRAQFSVESDGEAVFRIRDAKGAIRVKLGAGNEGSGLVLLDETTEPGVQIVARREPTPTRTTTTSIALTGAGGKHRVIVP